MAPNDPVRFVDDEGNPLGTATNPLITTPGGSGTGNVNLTQVGGSNFALGTNTAANSIPVVLASDGSMNLTHINGQTLNLGQTGAASSIPVTIASDQDAVPTKPAPGTGVNTPAIVTSAGDALAANSNRKLWSIQNLGTNPLFVRLATGASTTVFHIVLKGGTASDDGLGGFVSDEIHKGVVSVAGTSPRFTVTEIT